MRNHASSMNPNKRLFLRTCLAAAGGAALGLHRCSLSGAVIPFSPFSAHGDDEPWKWSKEALYYARTGRGVRCVRCPNFCELEDGEAGKCRNRVNYRGVLYTIAYGNPCAVHIDPIEKKPFFHYLPSTRAFSIAAAGCNMRCLNCQNWQISQFSPRETENQTLMPADVVDQCLQSGCESIAYTYSEPTTFYEYTRDTSALARQRKIKNLLKSNGYINEEPLRALCAHLDAANIDLKCFDDATYVRIGQARLAPVLKTLTVLHQEGVWLEITNLLIPGWTDSSDMIRRMCAWLCEHGLSGAPLHFSRFVPLYKLAHVPPTPVSVLERAREIALQEGVRFVYVGNVPGHAAESTYCDKCGKLLLERKGFAVLSSNLKGGRCAFCSEKIPGVWS